MSHLPNDKGIALWICQVMTDFQKSYGISLDDFLELDNKYDIVHYLRDNYEYHHYNAVHLASGDIVEHIRANGGDVSGISRVS